jgi:hypothetical protein
MSVPQSTKLELRNFREHPSVLKNSLVPSSDPCSEAQKPGPVVFWPRFLGVLDLFCAADPSDSDFFNSLTIQEKFAQEAHSLGPIGPVAGVW